MSSVYISSKTWPKFHLIFEKKGSGGVRGRQRKKRAVEDEEAMRWQRRS